MSHLTFTLSEARHRALKEATAQRSKRREDARDLVRHARARGRLDPDVAMTLALTEVKAARSGR